jgi:hypothetical protein
MAGFQNAIVRFPGADLGRTLGTEQAGRLQGLTATSQSPAASANSKASEKAAIQALQVSLTELSSVPSDMMSPEVISAALLSLGITTDLSNIQTVLPHSAGSSSAVLYAASEGAPLMSNLPELWNAVAVDIGVHTDQGLASALELIVQRKSLFNELQQQRTEHPAFKGFVMSLLAVDDAGIERTPQQAEYLFNSLTDVDKEAYLDQLCQRLSQPIAIGRYDSEQASLTPIDPSEITATDVMQALIARLQLC